MQIKTVSIPVLKGDEVSGVLSIPDGYSGHSGVIMAPGAGNDMSQPMLSFLSESLAEAGHLVLRFNFLYREKGKKVPDRQDILYATWESAYGFLEAHPHYRPRQIVAAGKSMGGRIASLMVAQGSLPAEKLAFFGYPLHAPGKKEKLRDQHLYQIKIPMLFFAGTRDQLCDLELLRNVLSRMTAPWSLEVIEGGDHSFKVPKSYGTDQRRIYERILRKMTAWLKE